MDLVVDSLLTVLAPANARLRCKMLGAGANSAEDTILVCQPVSRTRGMVESGALLIMGSVMGLAEAVMPYCAVAGGPEFPPSPRWALVIWPMRQYTAYDVFFFESQSG